MIKFFRHIRQRLLSENRLGKYLLYATGEIILVVIGILIALQINNKNEERKERVKEISYLNNLKMDLTKEIKNNENFAAYHLNKAETCSILLNGNAPSTIEEVEAYTDRYETVFVWYTFVPNNNTFKELLSSGNLSMITNDSIKNQLLELDNLYSAIVGGEYHMRREYEEYLYDPHVKNISALGFFDLKNPKYGLPNRLKVDDIPDSLHAGMIKDAQWQHKDQTFQNGLKLAMMNNSILAGMHQDMVSFIQGLLDVINNEMNGRP
jgi:hypothetical protein